jgi:glyoxalase family protein
MRNLITGLHHVTAMADRSQQNLAFYAGILGIRLVKKTVNFDAPEVYHLYYGDQHGNPGTILTFFPFAGLRKGVHGSGQMTTTSFSIPSNSFDYWQKRLQKFDIKYNQPQERLDGEVFIKFQDFDGLGLELVANDNDERPGITDGPVPDENSIRGFHSATLSVSDPGTTGAILTTMLDYKVIKQKNNRIRLSNAGSEGQFVDIVTTTQRGMGGSGTVHHLAFATASDEDQLQVRERIESNGLQITPVLDRQYFHSVYFREPGGVLFEVATKPPGFSVDEPVESLGQSLKLPEWIEPQRKILEQKLEDLNIDLAKYKD